MFRFHDRLNSFKTWPFSEEAKCTPEKLAQAGFYKIRGTVDGTICYYCEKELDGWEPEDEPFIEHKAHSKECPLIKMFETPPLLLSTGECIELETARLKYLAKKKADATINEFRKCALNMFKQS